MPDLLIDGEIFCQQSGGGISRIFEEIIPLLASKSKLVIPTIFLRKNPDNRKVYDLGAHTVTVWHPQVNGCAYRLRKSVGLAIDRYIAPIIKKRIKHNVFLSTYFTLPPKKDIPSIVFVYDMVYELFPDMFDRVDRTDVIAQKRIALEQASLVLCISKATLEDIVSLIGIPRERCRVVYLSGESFSSFNPITQSPANNKVRLLYVGKFSTPYKNFEFLLKSLATASNTKIRESELRVICRSRPSDDAVQLYQSIWSEGSLVFESNCNDQQLAKHYSDCSALVYPSLYEGFGIPLIEAHTLGVPVVCSDIPVFKEISGGLFFHFDPTSSSSFEKALSSALASGRTPEDVRKRKMHAAQFTWKHTAEGVLAAIKEVVS